MKIVSNLKNTPWSMKRKLPTIKKIYAEFSFSKNKTLCINQNEKSRSMDFLDFFFGEWKRGFLFVYTSNLYTLTSALHLPRWRTDLLLFLFTNCSFRFNVIIYTTFSDLWRVLIQDGRWRDTDTWISACESSAFATARRVT